MNTMAILKAVAWFVGGMWYAQAVWVVWELAIVFASPRVARLLRGED